MKLVHDLSQMPSLVGTVVTDGMFDGVHLGHQQILQQVAREGKKLGIPSVLVSYWPHPRHVLSDQEDKLMILTTLAEKAELIEKQGIDYMLVLPFTKEFSSQSHISFVQEVLVDGLHTKKLIVGYNHRFGQNRLGDFTYLQSAGDHYGFDLQEISQQEIEEIAISSTKIRYALQHQLVATANQFLGRLYSFVGRVEEGDKRGRTIGYPTANLILEDANKLVPGDGVYATWATVEGKRYQSMTNIGFRPTVDGKSHKIEAHLLDFEGDLYGKEVELEFAAPIREEQKFAGLEALKQQLGLDREIAYKLLND